MGCWAKLFALAVVLAAVSIGYIWQQLNYIPELPQLPETYWGPGPPKPDDTAIKPFKIQVSNDDLDDLMRRLNNTRKLTPPLTGVGFQYGFNTDYLYSLVEFWKSEYKWRERETYLNQLPQYTTQISGLKIHFIHAKPDKAKLSPGVKVLPLVLFHGWPGSVREFYELIPLLTAPKKDMNFVFEVVAPSMPGFAFSEAAVKPGLGATQMTVIMKKLMNRLGFDKFYVHGGDWGAVIANTMGVLYPSNVKAVHSSNCLASSMKAMVRLIASYIVPWMDFKDEGFEDRLSQLPSILVEETGYLHIQATKPDTVGVALSDSPVGLAAYILEKFSTGTNPDWRKKPDGGLSYYDRKNLLDNIMIYWFSESITTSMRLYSESLSKANMGHRIADIPLQVPTGCARFPAEMFVSPRQLIESTFPNLVRLTNMPKGGHFSSFEVPDLMAEDIWQFVKTVISRASEEKKN